MNAYLRQYLTSDQPEQIIDECCLILELNSNSRWGLSHQSWVFDLHEDVSNPNYIHSTSTARYNILRIQSQEAKINIVLYVVQYYV